MAMGDGRASLAAATAAMGQDIGRVPSANSHHCPLPLSPLSQFPPRERECRRYWPGRKRWHQPRPPPQGLDGGRWGIALDSTCPLRCVPWPAAGAGAGAGLSRAGSCVVALARVQRVWSPDDVGMSLPWPATFSLQREPASQSAPGHGASTERFAPVNLPDLVVDKVYSPAATVASGIRYLHLAMLYYTCSIANNRAERRSGRNG